MIIVKDLIKILLLERLSLRGICRVTGVSLTRLLDFIAQAYAESPDDLNVKLCQARGVVTAAANQRACAAQARALSAKD